MAVGRETQRDVGQTDKKAPSEAQGLGEAKEEDKAETKKLRGTWLQRTLKDTVTPKEVARSLDSWRNKKNTLEEVCIRRAREMAEANMV